MKQLQNASGLKGQHVMTLVRLFDECNYNYCPKTEDHTSDEPGSVVSGHQPHEATSGVRADNTPLGDIKRSKTGSGNIGRCSQGQGEGRDNIKYVKDICVLLGAVREEAWDFSSFSCCLTTPQICPRSYFVIFVIIFVVKLLIILSVSRALFLYGGQIIQFCEFYWSLGRWWLQPSYVNPCHMLHNLHIVQCIQYHRACHSQHKYHWVGLILQSTRIASLNYFSPSNTIVICWANWLDLLEYKYNALRFVVIYNSSVCKSVLTEQYSERTSYFPRSLS